MQRYRVYRLDDLLAETLDTEASAIHQATTWVQANQRSGINKERKYAVVKVIAVVKPKPVEIEVIVEHLDVTQ